MARRGGGVRWGRVLSLAFALLIINAPFVLHEVTLHRTATQGVHVTAAVGQVAESGDDYVVTFKLPANVDPKQTVRNVKVDHQVGLEAARTHQLDVQVLKGHPGAFHVDGQVRSIAPLVVTLVADILIALVMVLSWRLGRRLRRPTLVGVAVEDVQTGEEGSLLDKQADGTYVINGEVGSVGPSSLVLVLRDRDVEIQLRDHENTVAVGERARVRAQLVG
jgi:hypothetical protein